LSSPKEADYIITLPEYPDTINETLLRKEIDFIEEREAKLYAYEIKFEPKKVQPPKDWIQNYPNSEYKLISKENYIEFIT